MHERLKDLLVPHEGNDFRPDLLERVSIGVMLVLVLLSFAIANIQALIWISSDWLVSTILPSVIVDLTNTERNTESLTPLRRNDTLDAAAKLKADDMAKNEYFAHYSPAGVSPWHWFDEAGYDFLHAGENLAVHFTDSDKVVDAWMHSPSHRANIMNGDYTEIGVGTAKGTYKGFPTIFVVQLFGTPRASVPTKATVAGVSTADTKTSSITVEKVAMVGTSTNVAPATIAIESVSQNSATITPRTLEVTEATIATATPTLSEIARADDEDPVVVYSDLATTSRPGEPATPATTETLQDEVSLPLHTATNPSMWLEILYLTLAFTVVVVLMASIAYEWRLHHPVQIAYAGGLLLIMALLFYIHTSLTGSVLII